VEAGETPTAPRALAPGLWTGAVQFSPVLQHNPKVHLVLRAGSKGCLPQPFQPGSRKSAVIVVRAK